MVQFLNILLTAIWQILNIRIPIDDGISITPWSIFVFMAILSLVIRYIKRKGESQE